MTSGRNIADDRRLAKPAIIQTLAMRIRSSSIRVTRASIEPTCPNGPATYAVTPAPPTKDLFLHRHAIPLDLPQPPAVEGVVAAHA